MSIAAVFGRMRLGRVTAILLTALVSLVVVLQPGGYLHDMTYQAVVMLDSIVGTGAQPAMASPAQDPSLTAVTAMNMPRTSR